MREVIKGFFRQRPDNASLFIHYAGARTWEIKCNWYKTSDIIGYLQSSYPQYTFKRGQ